MSDIDKWREIFDNCGDLDLSPMFEDKTAVICQTNEEAMHLISVFKVMAPDIVAAYDSFPWTGWEGDQYEKYCGYDVSYNRLLRGNVSYYQMAGFRMIDFTALLRVVEIDIEESDEDILDFLKAN